MRHIFLLVILLTLMGCGGDPVSSIDPLFLVGTWSGISLATYPGPNDAPITSEEPIRFEFTDSTFQYFWIGDGGNENSPYGRGNYIVGDSTITFTDVILSGYYQPMDLQGDFEFGLIDSTLSLMQNPASFFQTYHLVTLEKVDVVITD